MTGLVALLGASGAIGHALAPEPERRRIPYRAVGRDMARIQGGRKTYTLRSRA